MVCRGACNGQVRDTGLTGCPAQLVLEGAGEGVLLLSALFLAPFPAGRDMCYFNKGSLGSEGKQEQHRAAPPKARTPCSLAMAAASAPPPLAAF